MILLKHLSGKKIGVLGLGLTGLSLISSAIHSGARVICWDDNKKKEKRLKKKDMRLAQHLN